LIEAILIIVGLIIGGVVGIYIGIMRGKSAVAGDVASQAGEVAGLTASLGEVRGQLDSRETELEAMRKAVETQKVAGAEANARLEAAREHFAEQRRQIEEMEKKVKETFAALSAAALKSSNEQFITLAEAKMKPLREQLERYEQHLKVLEKARAEAYGGLNKQLEQAEGTRQQLSRETQQLVAALRHPGTKGKWGEMSLKRIVELCGMTEHCDFETQSTQESRQRPDLVVHMPGGRLLAIDSKVNIGAYLDAVGATEEEQRKQSLKKYAGVVRDTMRQLGRKDYWQQFSPAPEFVVMFMPGEAFFAAAVSQDGDLIVDGLKSRVLLASPTTLIALLLAVAHGWQQQQLAENAEHIAAAGRELYERLCKFVEHLDEVREGIEKAAGAFNKVVGNWESRTLPSARKLKELGAADAGRDMIDLKRADAQMRSLPRPEDSEIDP
jgi:DNA recombination protein RmuC